MQKAVLWPVMNYLTASERMVIAAKHNDILLMVNLITKHSADPNTKDPDGMTALHFGSRNGSFEICEYLLKKTNNIKLDEKNKSGQTALFLATLMGVGSFRETLGQRNMLENKYNPIINLLINSGINVTNKEIDNLRVRNNRDAITILLKAQRSKCASTCSKSKNCNKYIL